MKTAVSKKDYVYYRAEGFYTVQDWNDEQAIKAVKKNPGTIKVDRIEKGRLVTIWPVKKSDA